MIRLVVLALAADAIDTVNRQRAIAAVVTAFSFIFLKGLLDFAFRTVHRQHLTDPDVDPNRKLRGFSLRSLVESSVYAAVVANIGIGMMVVIAASNGPQPYLSELALPVVLLNLVPYAFCVGVHRHQDVDIITWSTLAQEESEEARVRLQAVIQACETEVAQLRRNGASPNIIAFWERAIRERRKELVHLPDSTPSHTQMQRLRRKFDCASCFTFPVIAWSITLIFQAHR